MIATGAAPIRPNAIPGIALDTVFTAPEILLGQVRLEGKEVAVIGSGLTGLETTEALNESGNNVTVIEMAKEIAPGAWFQFVEDSMSRIKPYGTKFMCNTALCAVAEDHITVMDLKKKTRKFLPVDAVVLAMGVQGNGRLALDLQDLGIQAVTVGDADRSGSIAHAVHDAYDKLRSI